jgi:hypothetical protein
VASPVLHDTGMERADVFIFHLKHYTSVCCHYLVKQNTITAWLIYAVAEYHAVLLAGVVMFILVLWF